MCADQHNNLKPPASASDPETAQSNPNKVRSTRYDWAHDTAPTEAAESAKPKKIAARSSLFRRLLARFRDYFGSGRNPFDRDDGPDPMTAQETRPRIYTDLTNQKPAMVDPC